MGYFVKKQWLCIRSETKKVVLSTELFEKISHHKLRDKKADILVISSKTE